jgi:hypothetical protein
MAKSDYRVLTRVHHNKKAYEEGDVVALEPGEAAPLLAAQAIAELPEWPAAPTAKTEK